MFKGNKYCYIVFFVLLFLAFLSVLILVISEINKTKNAAKCYNPALVNTNKLQIGNRNFSEEEFQKVNETYFSICLEDKVPVLRKCCQKNQIINLTAKRISCGKAENFFDTELQIHDENDLPLPQYNLSNFYRQYGMIWCPNKKYRLNAKLENDSFTFRSDGTLSISGGNNFTEIENSDKFCLDMMVNNKEGPYLGAFVCFPEEQRDQGHLKLYPYGMFISMPFLFSIFLSHALIKELRTLHGLFVMSHTGSLLIFYIFLAISQINGKGLSRTFCKICGFTVQFSFLAAFFWLNIMSADMWWSIKNLRHVGRGNLHITKKELKKFLFCSFYGWGGPGIILCISLLMDLHPGIPDKFSKPHVGKTMCLIDTDVNKLSALYYLYGPMGIIIISNVYFFISTAVKISFIKKETKLLDGKECCSNKEESNKFTIYLKLFIAMGVTWLLELLSWAIGGPRYIWYIPDFSNSLQGLYIFMIFFPKVKKEILKKFCQGQSRHNSGSTKTSSVGRPCKNSPVSSANYSKKNDESNIQIVPVKCTKKRDLPCNSLQNPIYYFKENETIT